MLNIQNEQDKLLLDVRNISSAAHKFNEEEMLILAAPNFTLLFKTCINFITEALDYCCKHKPGNSLWHLWFLGSVLQSSKILPRKVILKLTFVLVIYFIARKKFPNHFVSLAAPKEGPEICICCM